MAIFVRFLVLGALLPLLAMPQARAADGKLAEKAAAIASYLASACPVASYDDQAAFDACAAALRKSHDIPFGRDVLWGGDQPNLRIRKKNLSHFNPQVFQWMYMPLMVFTGRWSVGHDDKDKVDVIRLEAYFRNALPASQYPYPFWHSSAKWSAYEHMNQLNLYLAADGTIFLATRGDGGSDDHRGPYAAATRPAFDGKWQWTDDKGQVAPRTMLFTSVFRADNPQLPRLDDTYRAFATQIREGSCVECHNPSRSDDIMRIVLLQTPIHAAGEIDNVIKQVRNGDMPQDDTGMRKDLPAPLREAILQTAERFRDALTDARAWETAHTP